jgi:hypothetical protein
MPAEQAGLERMEDISEVGIVARGFVLGKCFVSRAAKCLGVLFIDHQQRLLSLVEIGQGKQQAQLLGAFLNNLR